MSTLTRHVRPSLWAALWLTCWLALCVACTASDGQTGMEEPPHRDTWCEGAPPIYGDDC